jgi:iron complex outermembrane recepter protein
MNMLNQSFPSGALVCRLLLLIAGVVCTVSSLCAQHSLMGRVTNAATGNTLEGARVEIQGTGKTAVTDFEGVYRFSDLPAGTVNVSVSYTGLDTMVVPATVGPNQPNRADIGLTSNIYTLGQFVVSGEREGNAKAITLQRASAGVKNIVSTDALGSLAGNPADLAMRLPGVEGESVGGDIRYIRIRGMSHQLNTITMDGNRMADAGSAGATREYQFQQIGSDSIERIEVVKSPTPDMDADSIGGAVNMVSKSAFDRAGGRRISGSAGGIFRLDKRDTYNPNFALSYSEVFKERIGVAVNWGYRRTQSLIDIANGAHQAVPNDSDGPGYQYNFMLGDTRNFRARKGGGVRLDFKLSENSRFYVNTTLNKHREHANLWDATWATAQTVATRDAAGNLTGTGAIVPGYTDNFTEWRPVTNSVLTVGATATAKLGTTWHGQFGGVHRFRTWDIDYDLYNSKSKADYPGNSNLDVILRGSGVRLERGEDRWTPTITQTAGPDWTDINNYQENQYNIARMSGWDEYRGASLNAKKRFSTSWPTYLKAGVRRREQSRDLENKPFRATYVGPDGVQGLNPATRVNDDNLAQFINPDPENVIFGGRYPQLPVPSFPRREDPGSSYGYTGFNIDTMLRTNPQYFVEDVAFDTMTDLVGNTHFKEEISAAYLMANVEVGRFTVLAGVRMEETQVDAEGAKSGITPEERTRRAQWVGPVTPDEARRRVIAEYSEREERSGKYREWFPSVHVKYEPFRNFIARASFATNIGRPSIGQLIPRTTVNYDAGTVSTSNPSLLPQFANNYDISAEYYFEPAGVFSVGLFRKDIKQFIFTSGGMTIAPGADNGFDGDFAGYTLTTQNNGGEAKIKGFEINYSQQFTFLPGWWAGFGAFANLTRMEVEGNYGAGNAIGAAPQDEVAGFNPRTGNVGISYIRGRISIRAHWNYTDRYLGTYNALVSRRVYRNARKTVDVKTVFRLTRRLDLFCDVSNIFAHPDRQYEFGGGRPQVLHEIRPQVFAGINGRW